ncbi:hypothetical protein BZA77DRAFT_305897 [Pyronema omphalodes]|nr:hypothetical protein BZA77DRAFT_305897 [Pyronema omphalodes]
MENTIQQPGLEVATRPHDGQHFSDLEAPVGTSPESIRYNYPVDASQIMDPPAPKSWIRTQLRRKRVKAAIIIFAVVIIALVVVLIVVPRPTPDTPAVNGRAGSHDSASTSKTIEALARIPIPSDAPLAAVASGKVFFQTNSGDLVLSTMSTKSEEVIKPSVPAKNGTPLAAVELGNGDEIRLFYLSSSNIIQEYVYSNGTWSDGSLASSAIKTSSVSQLAACPFAINNQIRLYYQLSNNSLQEASYNIGGSSNEWSILQSDSLPAAKLGSGLSAINFMTSQIRFYFQYEDFTVAEIAWTTDNNKTWFETKSFEFSKSGGPPQRARALTAISAVRLEGAEAQQHVIYQSQAKSFVDERWVEKDRQWSEFPLSDTAKDPVDGTKIATTIDGGDITLYHMSNDGLRHRFWNNVRGWYMNDTDPLIPGS